MFVPLRVVVPAPSWVTLPEPLMSPPRVRAFERLKIRAALSTTFPTMLPVRKASYTRLSASTRPSLTLISIPPMQN